MNFHDPADAQVEAWRARFDALVRERMHQPFEWGVNDCCMWAAAAVQAVSGRDVTDGRRGTYSTALEAARVLKHLTDGAGLAHLGLLAGEPIAPLLAAVGDIGLLTVDTRECLGVCAGQVWLVVAEQGLSAAPLTAATQAWRVAHA